MLKLRPYKRGDAEAIVSWIKDEYAFRQWCADRYDHYPVTPDEIDRRYNEMAGADWFYPMTAFDENGIVGHLIMRFTDERKTVLRFGFVIVDSGKRGQGFGKEMLRLALKMAFEVLGAAKVTLGVFENNPAAYHCYKAAGFRDVPPEAPVYFHILGEDWKCLELQAEKTESPENAACEEKNRTRFTVNAVGRVRNRVADRKDESWGNEISSVVLEEPYVSGLKGLESFSHAMILYCLDQARYDREKHLQRRPRNRDDMPLVGIFAQRGKNRPNRIGITSVEILSVTEDTLIVKGLDAVDGTPVLDIKPYFPAYDKREASVPEWAERLMEKYF